MNHSYGLLGLFLIVGCASSDLAGSNETLSREITVNPDGAPKRLSGVVKSKNFNPKRTEARADQFYAAGAFDEAFGAYFATCEADFPKSCYRAAKILDDRLLRIVPADLFEPALQKILYQTACRTNFEDSCRRARSQS